MNWVKKRQNNEWFYFKGRVKLGFLVYLLPRGLFPSNSYVTDQPCTLRLFSLEMDSIVKSVHKNNIDENPKHSDWCKNLQIILFMCLRKSFTCLMLFFIRKPRVLYSKIYMNVMGFFFFLFDVYDLYRRDTFSIWNI